MQSLLINGKYYGFPGDRESLIHLFKAGESSKDSQYKETDSQLGASEITLGNPGGSHLQKELGNSYASCIPGLRVYSPCTYLGSLNCYRRGDIVLYCAPQCCDFMVHWRKHVRLAEVAEHGVQLTQGLRQSVAYLLPSPSPVVCPGTRCGKL